MPRQFCFEIHNSLRIYLSNERQVGPLDYRVFRFVSIGHIAVGRSPGGLDSRLPVGRRVCRTGGRTGRKSFRHRRRFRCVFFRNCLFSPCFRRRCPTAACSSSSRRLFRRRHIRRHSRLRRGPDLLSDLPKQGRFLGLRFQNRVLC